MEKHLSPWALTGIVIIVAASVFYHQSHGLNGIVVCCDAHWYISGALSVARDGLLAETPLAGYRSFFNNAFALALIFVGEAVSWWRDSHVFSAEPNLDSLVQSYAIGATTLHVISGLAIAFLLRPSGIALATYLAFYINPFAWAYVPFTLQEGQIILLLGPAIMVGLACWKKPLLRSGAIGGIVGLAVVLKPSLVPLAAFVALLGSAVTLRERHRLSDAMLLIAASIAGATIIVAPEIIRSLLMFQSPWPYPRTGVLSSQLMWGVELWKYDTQVIDHIGIGRRYTTPFAEVGMLNPGEFLLANPGAAFVLMISHVLTAFDVSDFAPYITQSTVAVVSPFNWFTYGIVFAGLAVAAKRYIHGTFDARDVLLDGILLLSLAPLPILATETRFGLLALCILFARATMWKSVPWRSSEAILVAIGLAMFLPVALLATALINATGPTPFSLN